MKSRSELLAGVVCGILSLAAAPVHAFTLGELSGVALIGRSLDVTVPVQSGPGEQASAACFTAELFHADTRQPAPNVSVTPTSGGTAVVRIQANTLVDEPIVSVELRARCGSTSTRRYTLLADVAPIETQATTASTAPRLPQIERSVVKPAAVDGIAIATVGPATQARTTVNKTRAAPNPRPRPPVASVKPAVAAGTSGSELVLQQPTRPLKRSGQAVLKLDPLDVFSDRIATLDSPMLFEPSADAMLQAQQISTLEADLKTLRSRLVRSDAELLELKTQLQQSQSEQVSALWVYVLGGLVLLCLAALAWLLVLQRKARHVQEPKWHDSQQHDSAYDLSEEMGPAAEHPPAALPHKEPALAPTRPAPGELGDKAVDTPRLSDTVPAALDGVQSFSVEPILDIRQQAEFFVSLGQTDRALHILKKQIDGASQPNPFIFLDLLTLQHSLGLKPDFRDSRNAFNRHFTGVVPEFAAFNTESKDLLDYPELLDRLVLDWPGPKSLSLLNGWIVRTHKGTGHISFDLAAFRDLLLLHAIAEDIAGETPSDAAEPPPEVSVSAVPDIFKTPASNTSVGTFDASMGLELLPKFDAKKVVRSSLPEELRVQSLDMDLTAFEGPPTTTKAASPAVVPPPRVPDIFLSDEIAQAHLPPVDKT